MSAAPARRPEVLLFDVGGVLIENAMFRELPPLMPEPVDPDRLRQRLLASPAFQAFERGESAPRDFAESFVREWDLRIGPDAFLETFARWPTGPYPGALDLLRELATRHRLALLSNCNPVHWDLLRPVRDLVPTAYASHEMGMVKPEPRIFERVCADLGVPPADMWFFDDSRPNVDAAEACGMTAYRTDGFPALEALVRKLGL